jgi:2,3,4,5-tetrahydropyridine-2-carboxylate N-succinyltransferase
MTELKNTIEKAWNNRALLQEEATITTIRKVIDLLDNGKLRVAEPTTEGWQVNEWVKKSGSHVFPNPEDGNLGSRYF